MPSGFIFYKGASLLDGQNIVGIATWGSSNAKTGNLLQTWILRSDMHPIEAARSGGDSSVCGNCPLRGNVIDGHNVGRSCYVQLNNAPSSIYQAYRDCNYPWLVEMRPAQLAKIYASVKGIRYGSYGDPVAIPKGAWNFANKIKGKKPGYTHQWQDKKFRKWATSLMASTHTLKENAIAHKLGFRTFRTINHVSEKADNEIICPASEESGFKRTCATCGACDGKKNPNDHRANVAIVAHGSEGKKQTIRRLIELPLVQG